MAQSFATAEDGLLDRPEESRLFLVCEQLASFCFLEWGPNLWHGGTALWVGETHCWWVFAASHALGGDAAFCAQTRPLRDTHPKSAVDVLIDVRETRRLGATSRLAAGLVR